MGVLTDLAPKKPEQQYIRTCTLIVYDTELNGLDLSNLRIKFNVKRSETMTPNTADIRVYNVSEETALSMLIKLSPTEGIGSQNRGRVVLQAGYNSNFGVIFQGSIKQVILGRESATDTFVDIIASDGSRAYTFAIINQTVGGNGVGATQTDQINAAAGAMAPKGVTLGHVGDVDPNVLPRGKVMYGNAKNYLRNVAQNTNKAWSIQDEKITFVPVKSYLPGERVVLTSKTGLIGTPQQTNIGMNIKCLLNPLIRVNSRIDIAEATVQDFKINLAVPNSAANIPAPKTQDGVYMPIIVEHQGDTRGIEWYTTLTCINMDVTTNPNNAVEVGY